MGREGESGERKEKSLRKGNGKGKTMGGGGRESEERRNKGFAVR